MRNGLAIWYIYVVAIALRLNFKIERTTTIWQEKEPCAWYLKSYMFVHLPAW